MKKLISLFSLLLALNSIATAQEGRGNVYPHSPQSKPFWLMINYESWHGNFQGPYYDGINYHVQYDRYEAIRIGEYFWLTTNVRNQKTYSDSPNSN